MRGTLVDALTPAGRPFRLDLDVRDRVALHTAIEQQRALEASLHPGGLSTTARAVLARLRG